MMIRYLLIYILFFTFGCVTSNSAKQDLCSRSVASSSQLCIRVFEKQNNLQEFVDLRSTDDEFFKSAESVVDGPTSAGATQQIQESALKNMFLRHPEWVSKPMAYRGMFVEDLESLKYIAENGLTGDKSYYGRVYTSNSPKEALSYSIATFSPKKPINASYRILIVMTKQTAQDAVSTSDIVKILFWDLRAVEKKEYPFVEYTPDQLKRVLNVVDSNMKSGNRDLKIDPEVWAILDQNGPVSQKKNYVVSLVQNSKVNSFSKYQNIELEKKAIQFESDLTQIVNMVLKSAELSQDSVDVISQDPARGAFQISANLDFIKALMGNSHRVSRISIKK